MKTYKNPISTAMSEYREDFHYNREWWTDRMGTGNNDEYLYIQFKNGDIIVIQSDYFQLDGNTCLPRFRADEVAYISRYYGDQCETTTANNIVVDTDRIILYRDGVEYFHYEMTEEEYKEMRRQIWGLDESINVTAWMLDYCRALATSKMNNQPEPTNPDNTPFTMNANETRYNYLKAVTADVLDYIKENGITVTANNREEIEEQLRDDLWACDSVTGNGSGSYTFNRWTAETYICHNLDLLAEAVEEFGGNMDVLKDGAEAQDVTIRCYLLAQAIAAALDEVEETEE